MDAEFEIQTTEQVLNIRNREAIQNQVEQTINEITPNINTDIIDEKLDIIIDNITNTEEQNSQINVINEKIDDINTSFITTQNNDIIMKIEQQDLKIKTLEEKLDLILDKL